MFTEQQLKAAHSKVKTGADFPKYISEIKQLGLISYEFWVNNGSIIYHGTNGYVINGEPKYPQQVIAQTSSSDELKHAIIIHQQGLTDFITFCQQAAAAGIEKWVIDTKKMVCIYYDAARLEMVTEPIPQIV